MYAYESPQFNSGMLTRYLSTELAQIGKASGLVLLLISHVNWKQGAENFGPRGTVNHLTVRKMAKALNCSQSTVKEHLAILRAAGIIESETVADHTGAIQYCRLWFAGFVSWLRRHDTKPVDTDVSNSPPPPDQGGGGPSEKPATYHSKKSQIIIDLEKVKSVWSSSLEEVIREAQPKLANGQRADSQMVFERFRSFNLRKGTSRISLAALRGFAKSFTEFRAKAIEPRQTLPVVPQPTPAAITIDPESPVDAKLKRELRTREPKLFDAWFANLSFSHDGDCLRVKAPTIFIRTYVCNHYEQLIRDAAGPGAKVVFA